MSGRPTKRQEAALLAWVNRQRKELGREPVERLEPGRCGALDECPIARSIGPGTRVYPEWVWIRPTSTYWKSLPCYVQTFIRRFDAGEYPGLER